MNKITELVAYDINLNKWVVQYSTICSNDTVLMVCKAVSDKKFTIKWKMRCRKTAVEAMNRGLKDRGLSLTDCRPVPIPVGYRTGMAGYL